jgi:hypothetical protein
MSINVRYEKIHENLAIYGVIFTVVEGSGNYLGDIQK